MTDQLEITSRKRRPEARPAEILEAALDLFTERGFKATRLEDVASRAGLSKAAIYLYFKDKMSLLTALVQAMAGTNIDLASNMVAQHQGPVAPLLRQLLGFMAGRIDQSRMPDLMKLVISESRAHPEIGRFYLENVIAKGLPLFQSIIERGIASGEFRKVDPRLTVKCLVGPMVLAAIWKSAFEPIGAEPIDVAALAAHHADFIIRALQP
jgi:AcrR family transcriptional regulator